MLESLFISTSRFAPSLDLLDHPVEIALEQRILHDAVFLELTFGVRHGDFGRHLASILKHLAIGCLDEAVEAHFPILHGV